MSCVVGVWASAGSSLLAEVQSDVPLLRLTLRRCKAAALPLYCLIPWTKELDHLADDVRRWGFQARRTHADERIAMRDLVAERSAEIGICVRGDAAAVDVDEIHLALARLDQGVPDGKTDRQLYFSPRVRAFKAADWLKNEAPDEWPDVLGQEAAKRFFHGASLDGPSRALAARKEERPRND